MKKMHLIIGLATLLGLTARADTTQDYLSRPASTDPEHRFGAGLIVGEPTGLSAKYWLNSTMAIDGAAGWSFVHDTDPYLHADVLWHKFDLFHVPEGRLPLYFGVGGRIKFRDNDDERFGIRVPIGVSYMFDNTPVDIFAEVAPILDVSPNVRGSFAASIGARFWF